jgi:hypothetical protein
MSELIYIDGMVYTPQDLTQVTYMLDDEDYKAEYSFLLFVYGDVFRNIYRALHLREAKMFNIKIPHRYNEATSATVDFYNRWHGVKDNEQTI